jgi:DNA-binding GntR family transcriptional regulator
MSELRVVRPESLSDIAHSRLRQAILIGDLRAGHTVSVVSLAAEMGISRSPIRMAIERLQAEGLVTQTPGGAVVEAPSRRELLDALAVRGTLENLAATLAADRLTDSDVTQLRRAHGRFAEAIDADDYAVARQRDLEFHRLVQVAAANETLIAHLDRVQTWIVLASYSSLAGNAIQSPELYSQPAVNEHAEILAALAAHDSAAAGAAAAAHMDRLAGRFRRFWAAGELTANS